jgi:Mg2+/Co2+ transporter CorB
MLALFDLIRVPCELFKISNTNVPAPSDTNLNTQKDQNNKEQSNVDKLIAGNNRLIESKKIAFADLVAHIAFLKTLPAPPFNSIFNVHMLPVVINN